MTKGSVSGKKGTEEGIEGTRKNNAPAPTAPRMNVARAATWIQFEGFKATSLSTCVAVHGCCGRAALCIRYSRKSGHSAGGVSTGRGVALSYQPQRPAGDVLQMQSPARIVQVFAQGTVRA